MAVARNRCLWLARRGFAFLLYGMRISRIFGPDVMNMVSMSIGQIGFSRTLPGVTGAEPAGDRTSGAFEKVTERTFIENTREQPTV